MVVEKKAPKAQKAEKAAREAPKATKSAKTARPAPAAPSPSVAAVDARNPLQQRKGVVGTVVSDRMQKTIVVKVDRRVRSPLYKKYVVTSRRFKAHDERNEAKIGDIVELLESRPLSREKRWVLRSIVRKAGQTAEANV